MLGSILYYARCYDQATRKLQSNLEIESEELGFSPHFGRVYQHTGRLSEALEEFQRAKQAEPQSPEITASIGVAYALLGKQVIENVFTPEQNSQMSTKLTDAMVSIEGENLRPATVVLIEETRSGDSVGKL